MDTTGWNYGDEPQPSEDEPKSSMDELKSYDLYTLGGSTDANHGYPNPTRWSLNGEELSDKFQEVRDQKEFVLL